MTYHFENLKRIKYEPKPRRFLTDLEIAALPVGSAVMCDVEVFKNLFFVGFKHVDTDSYFYVEATLSKQLEIEKLRWIMWHFELTTFNGRGYDIRIIEAALKGACLSELKELSDRIIIEGERFWQPSASFNHVDIMEVAPLKGSLKLYAARLHCQRMQELPVDPHSELSIQDACDAREYNMNDLDNTALLREGLADPLQLRRRLSDQYGEDMRSKSDAQIAETIISIEFKRRTGRTPSKSQIKSDFAFKYEPPSYMQFQTELMQKTFEQIKSLTFTLDAQGYVNKPPEFKKLLLNIGNAAYQMSIGGLHSQEVCVAYRSSETHVTIDCDVSSYYPQIIITGGIEPANMQGYFIPIYKGLTDRRLMLKLAKNPDADGFKIVTNGTFGKLGSPHSIFYSPNLMIYVTLTGQLGLLMLIEDAALHGFHIASANTDGVLFYCERSRIDELNAIIKVWEAKVGFALEQTRYKSYFARDVNNYIAVKENGGTKSKGAYTEKGSALNSPLSKNPEALICSDAVKELLEKGTPVEKTICESRDVRRFVCVRNVEGSAHKNGVYLGRTIRWYYARGEYGAINYISNGNRVPKTDGAKPLMELNGMPDDIDFNWYVTEAIAILHDIGYFGRNKQKTLFD